MEKAKKRIAIAACGLILLLTVCIILSVASIVMLGKSAQANADNDQRIEGWMNALNDRLFVLEHSISGEKSDSKTELDSAIDTSATPKSFYLRIADGKIAIFSSDGVCLYKSNVDVTLLPAADREHLANGIEIHSLQELLSLVKDYTG